MTYFQNLILKTVTIVSLLSASSLLNADTTTPLIDDFSDTLNNSLGHPRQFIDDTSSGGKTIMSHSVADGVLTVEGNLLPARGQPGWASAILLLDAQGGPVDASAHNGIVLRVRIKKGNLSVSANSAEITNFDYHAAVVTRQSDGAFHTVKIPFASMKRTWSEQTPLNPKTLSSISLVSFGVQSGEFHFEVEEVSFY